MKNNQITILSTFAKDRLLNERGVIFCEQKGGPGYYLKNVFNKEKVSFDFPIFREELVEILVSKDKELGKIPKKLKVMSIDFSKIKSSFTIISTLLNEFNLDGISKYNGQIFLDIQGYVRNGENFGKKKYWEPSEKIFDSIYCLKGTAEEIKYLPKILINKQKEKMLLITKGKKGSVLFTKGKKYVLEPEKILKIKDAIGAGDTLFAYFISKLITSNEPLSAINYATQKTSEFLSFSSHHTNPF